MPGNKSKSLIIADNTEINFSKAEFGHNSSLSSNASIEEETLLSNNSNVSLSGLLGNKSFIERVQCASDVSQLSILFPTGCLGSKKVKKKRKQTNTSKMEIIENTEDNFATPRNSNDAEIKIGYDSENCKSEKFDKRNNVSIHMQSDSFQSTISDKTCENDESTFHVGKRTAEEDTIDSKQIFKKPPPGSNAVLNERPLFLDGNPRKKVSVHFDFDTSNTLLNDTEGVLESNTKSYGPSNMTTADVNADLVPDKENIKNKDEDDKITSRSLKKSSKNKRNASVNFEFDSTLKKDIIPKNSSMDITENITTKELETTEHSNKITSRSLRKSSKNKRNVSVNFEFDSTLKKDIVSKNSSMDNTENITPKDLETTEHSNEITSGSLRKSSKNKQAVSVNFEFDSTLMKDVIPENSSMDNTENITTKELETTEHSNEITSGSLRKSSKNKQAVSVNFEFDSTLMKDVIPENSSMDNTENITTKELETTEHSNKITSRSLRKSSKNKQNVSVNCEFDSTLKKDIIPKNSSMDNTENITTKELETTEHSNEITSGSLRKSSKNKQAVSVKFEFDSTLMKDVIPENSSMDNMENITTKELATTEHSNKITSESLRKSSKNEQDVSVNVEFDSTSKKNIVPKYSSKDNTENITTKELNNSVHSNSDKGIETKFDSSSEVHVTGNFSKSTSQKEVCCKNNISSSKNSKDVSYTGNITVTDQYANCEGAEKLKQIKNTSESGVYTQQDTQGINTEPHDSQHKQNSTYTISTSKTQNSLNCIDNNDLGKHPDEDNNVNCESHSTSGSESIKGKINSSREINTTYTLASKAQEVHNSTDTSLERFAQNNNGENMCSTDFVADSVNAKPLTDSDLTTKSYVHSSLLCTFPVKDVISESNDDMNLVSHGNPLMNPEVNNSFDKEQDITCSQTSETNMLKNKSLNNKSTPELLRKIDGDKEINDKLEYKTTENESLDGDNLNKSGNCQSKNLKHKQNHSLEPDLANLSSVSINVPTKISDVSYLGQIEDQLSTPKSGSNLSDNNHQESLPKSIELDISIRATSPILNCVALPSPPYITFTGKDITDDSERLRDSNTEDLDVDPPRSRDMKYSKRSLNSTVNENIPGVLQGSLADVPSLVENLSDKSHKQVVSEEVPMSPKVSNKSDEMNENVVKDKICEESNKTVEKIATNDTKTDRSTDISSVQTKSISTNNIETNPVSSSETKLIQVLPKIIMPVTLFISPNHNNENSQEINTFANLDKTNTTVIDKCRSSENSECVDSISTIDVPPKSNDSVKRYGLRKSRSFSPKCNEKESIKGKRKSVTFASTARVKSDSQSGEISLNTPTALKSRIISGKNKSSGTLCTVDSEFDMSMTEAISVIPNVVSGAFEGRKNCHSTPINKTQAKISQLKEISNNLKENESKDSHIFACPEVPEHKLTRSKAGNTSNTDKKRNRKEDEVNIVGSEIDKSESSKRRRTVDKTINELSYDNLSDVSEIPLDKTIHQKKLIYHSTPINPVLEKKSPKTSLSDRRRGSLNKHKDKIIQVSKTYFGTSSEITASISKKKSGDELSTSYSYGGKLASSKRNATSTSYSKRLKKEVTPRRFSRRSLSSQSTISGDSMKSTLEQSSDGNKASNEESSSIRVLRSGNITSTLTQSVDETSYSHRVRFRNFSSHIDSCTSISKNSNSSEKSNSISNIRRNIDEFDLTPGTPSRASIGNISQNSYNNGTFSGQTSLTAFRSDDNLGRNLMVSNAECNESPASINQQTLKESLSRTCEYTLSTPQILSLQSKIKPNEETFEEHPKDQLIPLKRRKQNSHLEAHRLVINGKLYVPPKIKFNEKWVSLELFNLCVNRLKKKYDTEATVLAERIVSHLCATVSAVKALNNYDDIEAQTLVLRNLLKKYDICSNMLNYYSLIMKFTPFEFQRKVLPMGGYYGSFKIDSAIELTLGDPIVLDSEIITIS